MHFRTAREMWEPTRMPTNYQKFLKRAHEDANEAQVATLLEQAPREDLIAEIQRLRAENAQLRMAAELNRNTIIGMCRND